MTTYLQTDEQHEAARALEMFHHQLILIKDDVYYWKWAIIALHNAVQAFIVCAISGTDQLGALKPKDAEEWLNAYYRRLTPPSDVRLDFFPELYKRAKEKTGFKASEDFDMDIETLTALRNDFIHFTPKGWSLEVSGLPQIFLNCLTLIEYLGWNAGCINWYEEPDENQAKGELDQCKKILASLR